MSIASEMDLAAVTARVNGELRKYGDPDGSWLGRIRYLQDLNASCIADDAAAGRTPYRPWVEDFIVLSMMRERVVKVQLTEALAGLAKS